MLSCEKQASEPTEIKAELYHQLYDELTKAVIHDVYSPPVASRIYVYPNIAAYQCISYGSNNLKSLNNQLTDLKIVYPEIAENVNYEQAAIIAYLDVAEDLIFTKEKLTVFKDSLYQGWEDSNSKEFQVSQKFGNDVSKQIKKWMSGDNYNATRSFPDFSVDYQQPGRWMPTPPTYIKGIEPHWSKLRPFCIDSSNQFKPIPPPEFSLEKNSKFYKELIEVYEIVKNIREVGNASEEIEIARFWDCNPFVSVNVGHYMFAEKKITPGAHWIGICKIACQKSEFDLEKTVQAYSKTTIAIADAFISCWDEKYRSNLIRPETVINSEIDAEWLPILQTPPFPEYTSGHSVVSGCSAVVLTSIFGDNFSFDDTTEIDYGLPVRSFSSFKQAAEEAAVSRIYGGIHYDSAVEKGLEQGIQIGSFVNSNLDMSVDAE